MQERDPRVDPMPGDVLRMKLTGKVRVTERGGNDVAWCYPENPAEEFCWKLHGWREAFGRAVVLKRGDQP